MLCSYISAICASQSSSSSTVYKKCFVVVSRALHRCSACTLFFVVGLYYVHLLFSAPKPCSHVQMCVTSPVMCAICGLRDKVNFICRAWQTAWYKTTNYPRGTSHTQSDRPKCAIMVMWVRGGGRNFQPNR